MTLCGSAPLPSLGGVWQSDGYGELFAIDDKGLCAYETTSISCIPAWKAIRVDEKADGIEGVFKLEGEAVKLSVWPGPTPDAKYFGMPWAASRMLVHRLGRAPGLGTRPADTPLANFDVFWTTFAEQYPFFALHVMDWQAVRNKYRPRITAATKPEELFTFFREMIEPLHDAHTFLDAGSIKKRFHSLRADTHPPAEKDLERFKEIITQRLHGGLHSECNGRVSYGMLDDGVGYLRITGFQGYTKSNDFEREVAALDKALDDALKDAPKWRGLVVDVRVNGGGSDVLGVTVASRLATRDYLAFAKRARSEPNDPAKFTPPQATQVRVSPKTHFGGKVVLLTSRRSISAAETFTMALMGRSPPVTRVGENTQGVFSDVLWRKLPNGWRFGLPNEIFLTEGGESFDVVGIPPHIAVAVFGRDDLDKGRDPAIDKALELIASK
jgi:hypothetical protein